MVLMKKGTLAAALLIASFSFGQTAFAQDAPSPKTETQDEVKFSEDELRKFINANTAAVELQKEGRQAVVDAIEEANLTLDRFNELAKANRSKTLDEVAENKEEIKAFGDVVRKVVKIQPDTKQKIAKAITDEGLTVEKYETILAAFQEDLAVQTKVKLLLQTEE
jgi:translation initiation factor 1 (eIF-1/SUI1)